MALRSARYFESVEAPELLEWLYAWAHAHPRAGGLVLLAEADRGSLSAVQDRFRHAGLKVVGGVFPELIVGAQTRRHGLNVLLLPDMPSRWIAEGLGSEHEPEPMQGGAPSPFEEMLEGIARAVAGSPGGREHALLLLCDAVLPNTATLLERLFARLADSLRYLGANAGSESFHPIAAIFDEDRAYEGAVLGLLLEEHSGAVLAHGYQRPDALVPATATAGNRIASIDWRPAFDVYRELAHQEHGLEITSENFYDFAVHYPIGIIRPDGEILVRIPVHLGDDGSLVCAGEIPESSVLTLLRAAESDSIQTVQAIAEGLKTAPAGDALTFYCAGRRRHMGSEAGVELRNLGDRLRPRPVHGALSLGEIGSTPRSPYPLFHNAAVLCAPWPDAPAGAG